MMYIDHVDSIHFIWSSGHYCPEGGFDNAFYAAAANATGPRQSRQRPMVGRRCLLRQQQRSPLAGRKALGSGHNVQLRASHRLVADRGTVCLAGPGAAVLLPRVPQLHQPRPAVLVSCPLPPSLYWLPPRSGFQAAVTVLARPVESIFAFGSAVRSLMSL